MGMDEHNTQPAQGSETQDRPKAGAAHAPGADPKGSTARGTSAPEADPGPDSGSKPGLASGTDAGDRSFDRAHAASRQVSRQTSDDLFSDPVHAAPHAASGTGVARGGRSQTAPRRSLKSQILQGVDRMSKKPFLQGKTWSFLLSVNILMAVVFSFILVWVSIERMDINYFINLERSRLREKQSLHGKLEVEKERLLSPYELRLKAEKLGMKAPAPGQIRRMDLSRHAPAARK